MNGTTDTPKIETYAAILSQDGTSSDNPFVRTTLQNTTPNTTFTWTRQSAGKYIAGTIEGWTADTAWTISGSQDGKIVIMASGAGPVGYYCTYYDGTDGLTLKTFNPTGTLTDIADLGQPWIMVEYKNYKDATPIDDN